MPAIKAVTVFGGASSGSSPVFREMATALGEQLARAGITVIFGGGSIGMMGAVADGALAAGGQVIGVIPDFLARREVAHTKVTEMIVTDSMHSRKRRMFDMSDAFVTLPGGLGTLDETFEMITWRQLDLHAKPLLVCDIEGWGTIFADMVDSYAEMGFVPAHARDFFEVLESVEAIVARLVELPVVETKTDSARL
ncbi:LOG family protein [Acidisoma silvae]|uniref:Cytokinin riboside 5'-monophosphate phosphoribohydrolase n=1 Tax=Acidisoma silvae TaxID=2802396 RepID=A0A963YNU9_9PROT|nr:TIGR00730 family Rossman fold protein [Acidisoma silvae]MCB8873650.1 TIGR00730 family Rossman fold protein [Acidisoma silvae]